MKTSEFMTGLSGLLQSLVILLAAVIVLFPGSRGGPTRYALLALFAMDLIPTVYRSRRLGLFKATPKGIFDRIRNGERLGPGLLETASLIAALTALVVLIM